MTQKPRMVLFVPFYNEASRRGIREYLNALSEMKDLDFILVNDGSSDSTLELLEAMASSRMNVFSLPQNVGKGEALRIAMQSFLENNSSEMVGYLDCDGAFPIKTVIDFKKSAQSKLLTNVFDVCIASRVQLSGRKVMRKRYRHYISRIIITLIGLRFAFMPYDSQSGLKFFSVNQRFIRAINQPFKTRWLFDIELLSRVSADSHGGNFWEEPVLEWQDKDGSHLRFRSLFRIVREILILFIRVKRPIQLPHKNSRD